MVKGAKSLISQKCLRLKPRFPPEIVINVAINNFKNAFTTSLLNFLTAKYIFLYFIAGEVSWEEYHAHFLRSHGFSEKYISSHDKKHSELPRSLKESIMRDRARWIEAARSDPEKLALDEFLAFTHPESSHRALLQMVEDLFEKFGELIEFFSFHLSYYDGNPETD